MTRWISKKVHAMLSVLIVEDEILVSIGLKNMINWSSMDMRVIAEARNGEEAYALYQSEKPDIILTDIRMPVMDGMELIAKIRETDNKTKIIILTCYQEFDLVHKALKLGVSDYILKLKMSTQEMETVIQKVRNEIESESLNRILNKYTDADIQITRNSLLLDYVLFQRISENEFSDIAGQLKLRLDASRLVLCLLNIDNYTVLQSKFEMEYDKTFRMATLNLLGELLRKHARGEAVHERDGRYLLIFSYFDMECDDDARASLFHCLSVIRDNIKAYVNATVTFGISSFGEGYASLKGLFAEAVSCLEQSFFTCGCDYIQYGRPVLADHYIQSMLGLRDYITLLQALNVEYKNEILAGIDQLMALPGTSKDRIIETFVRWIHWPTVHTYPSFGNARADAIEYASRIHASTTLNRAIEIFRQYLSNAAAGNSHCRGIGKEVAEAMNYIHENYSREISLGQVAESIEISANYLSSLFRKELQIRFVDYINQIRINKAKEMLATTHLKSYEIAQRVGFLNESYFSRIFKKLTGLRPNEYKRKCVSFAGGSQGNSHVE